eukprot:CAMPEP_0198587304 /NCGR_PEP_ID=MMETSP1462-20131121/131684_1 /TAXON_ID=1333877 /ORGANISM="Brandtodinium nutriculum, Strain RCC3387" /LENGTH=134 /DNA_ID=CAMNT_0044318781 /DNA_START=93 /DNA_END=493 /DNA_ORIENTATION=-
MKYASFRCLVTLLLVQACTATRASQRIEGHGRDLTAFRAQYHVERLAARHASRAAAAQSSTRSPSGLEMLSNSMRVHLVAVPIVWLLVVAFGCYQWRLATICEKGAGDAAGDGDAVGATQQEKLRGRSSGLSRG